MTRIALVCAAGIGDALITSIAAHSLRKKGYQVTVFSRHLMGFGQWLEEGDYRPCAEDWAETLHSFGAVLLQHDNTPRARSIVELRKLGMAVSVFYTNYRLSKHGPLENGYDYPFDDCKTMVDNTCTALQVLFNIESRGQNSLLPPPHLVHRLNNQRVLIHPTSTSEEKNWLRKRFLRLANKLEKRGFEPLFILSPKERAQWPDSLNAHHYPTLADLASAIYESGAFIGNDSGPAHLASYLSIPLAVICQGRQMPLWSPGWHRPLLIQPPQWVPNIKGMRFRENKWKYFVTTKHVLNKSSLILKLK
jgi:hypothetical protein